MKIINIKSGPLMHSQPCPAAIPRDNLWGNMVFLKHIKIWLFLNNYPAPVIHKPRGISGRSLGIGESNRGT